MQSGDHFWESFRKISMLGRPKSACKRKTVYAVFCGVRAGELVEVASASNGPIGGPCSGEIGKCGCIHAEVSLLLALPKWARGILCVNYSPCTNCANAIIASRAVAAVLYSTLTEHDPRGVEWLKNAGIITLQEGDFIAPSVMQELSSCSVSPTTRS